MNNGSKKTDYDGFNLEIGDGRYTIYTDVKYDVPAGKYLLSVKGYVRKEAQEFPTQDCGFYFSFRPVEAFEKFKNPRESDDYDFNVGSMKQVVGELNKMKNRDL